jgi:hypothetical protein
MPKKITESILQRAVLDWLGSLDGIYFFRSGAGQVKTEGGRFFKTGKPGCPDVTVCVGCGDADFPAVFVGLEIKTETGRQSATQKKAQEEIEAAGGRYYLIRNMDEVKNAIQKTIEDMRILRSRIFPEKRQD